MNYNEEETHPRAVYCRGLRKTLGSGRSKTDVLCGLNMNVPYGAIYGLLGSSGCGKTTLLKCIVGRLKLDRGHILTLGKPPGSRGHYVPGRKVGYMPQDIALYMKFSIAETLTFFGRLHDMRRDDIKRRTSFLLGFLTLPEKGRLVASLSEGQQRRVSLAAALLQEPELLILDEPTVGVDPVLREKIWEHLLEIAKSSLKTTIIITTHYIEEAALADRVGLMRGGRLLAENKPSVLMARYDMLSLEAVFLHLCHRDRLPNDDDDELLPSVSEPSPYEIEQEEHALYNKDNGGDNVNLLGGGMRRTAYGTLPNDATSTLSRKCCNPRSILPAPKNIFALSMKNLISMRRNIPLLAFEFAIPVVQIVLFCVCIGREPHALNLSICNEDVDELGGLFISFLDNNTIVKVMRDDLDTALNDVKMGWSWSAMHLRENFSLDLMTRLEDGLRATNETLNGSTVWMYQDMTNQQITITIHAKILEAFGEFSSLLLSSFGYNPNMAKLPVEQAEPVYGDLDTSFTDFMAVGLIVSATFFLATGLTTLTFVLERKEGLLERTYVAGVSAMEIMVSHVLTQVSVMFGQVILMFAISLLVFNVPNNGNILLLVMLVILQGLCGMTLGMVISAVSRTENAAIQGSLGLMYPAILVSGIIWPIESMPSWMMTISHYLPMTIPTYAVRSIMGRGWGLDRTIIWGSYFISVIWIFIHSVLAGIILKFKAD